MSMMLGVGPGSLLLGVAVARESTDATTRYAGAFLALAAATFVGLFLTRGVVPESVALVAFFALPVAWAVYGYARRSSERASAPVAAPAV